MNRDSFPQSRSLLNTEYRTLFTVTTVIFLFLALIFPPSALSHSKALKVVAPWEIKSADPAKSGYIYLRMQIIETLVNVDHQGNTVPGLATAWQASEDGLEWRLTIRQGVKFHDGTSMTPESVVNSLKIALKKPGMLGKVPIKDITHQDKAVSIWLNEPYAILDSVLSHYSTGILSPSAYEQDGKVIKLIATGPYTVLYIKPPQELQTIAFKGYWGPKPNIGATHYLAVGRNETRGLMAQSGDADIIFTLDPVTLKRLQKFKRISTYCASLPRTIVIKLNCAVPGLDTPQLRKALSDGLDRKGISLTVMRMENAAADQLFPKSLGPWHIDALNLPNRAPLDYKKLMMANGWKEDKDGYLQQGGKSLELELVTYSDRPELPTAATALQDQMRKMGIKLNISITNSSAIPQGHKEGTLQMGLIARNYGLISNPLGTILQDYSKGGGDWGAMNWKSKPMQELLTKLRKSTDPGMQKDLIQTASKLLGQEMPTIPIVSYLHTAVTSKEIVNFSLDPLERSYRITELNWSDLQ
jgi:peptide/nickel transport system substrate-binding protein